MYIFKNNTREKIERLMQGFTYEKSTDEDCLGCKFEGLCKAPGVWDKHCPLGDDFNDSKETILIIDDNPNILEFLKEDIECLTKAGIIDISKYNLIFFTNSRCAFQFYSFQQKRKGLNIKYAIIDLEYNGAIVKDNESIKLNGVDVYESILDYNSDVEVVFYSNQLNDKINSHRQIIEQYNNTTGKSIHDCILDKTFSGLRKRREEIAKKLFKKELTKDMKCT